MPKKVFVSGCYDLLHSGHVEFFRRAAQYGELHVGIGSDATYLEYKHRQPMFPQEERLFMVQSIRYVHRAYINEGHGFIDFVPTLDLVQPDIFIVNADGGSPEKRRLCQERHIQYLELDRTPASGLLPRSSTSIKSTLGNGAAETQAPPALHHPLKPSEKAIASEASEIGPLARPTETSDALGLPTRLDLAGTWIDQPYVSQHHPGWAITISLEPTFPIRDRCGLSTSTRKMIQQIWPDRLPQMAPEMLARLVFCFENHPERPNGHISGAQDAIGICIPGLSRHYYDNSYWPTRIETITAEPILTFLESHLVMIPIAPRLDGCSVVEDKRITPEGVRALAQAADDCWNAILARDLYAFAAAYLASFRAQVSMFPGMVKPTYVGHPDFSNAYIQQSIDHYSALAEVLAWKMPGAGGGGYLALVVSDAPAFCIAHPEAIPLHIRRS